MAKLFKFILASMILTSCSLAPFGPTPTARSYGQGHVQTEVGNNNSSYILKFGLGLTKEFDAGFIMEFGELSTSAIFMKYAFINNETGPSAAMEFGYGSTDTTIFYYGGIVGSLAFSKEFEVFVNARVNSVSTDQSDIEKDKFYGNIKITDYNVSYLQGSAGFNIWFNKISGLSLYATYFAGEKIETQQDTIFGGSLLFNF